MRILSLDGGGVRSVFSAQLVVRLEQLSDFFSCADLLVGTSGGAIVAGGLACGIPASEIVEIFRTRSKEIFKPEPFFSRLLRGKLRGPKYQNRNLYKVLHEVFGDRRLGDVERRLLLTAFDLRHPSGAWQPAVFHNFPGPKSSRHLRLVDVIMRSAAAPTYFPIYEKHIDGGVWANNPAMAGISAAINPSVGGARSDHLFVLSIGTGRNPRTLDVARNSMDALHWYQAGILDILLDGPTEAICYYAESFLGKRYHRLNLDLFKEIAMDEAIAVPEMIDLANKLDLGSTYSWLRTYWTAKTRREVLSNEL